MFFKLKITFKNTGFLPSYDYQHIDQLFNLMELWDNFRENIGKNPLSIRESYKVL